MHGRAAKTALLLSRLVNNCSVANTAFDPDGRFGPAKRAGIFVPVRVTRDYFRHGIVKARGRTHSY